MRKLGFLAALLAAGLAASGKSLTRDDAAELLMSSETAGKAVRDALDRALPNAKGPKTDPRKAARKGGTGRKS